VKRGAAVSPSRASRRVGRFSLMGVESITLVFARFGEVHPRFQTPGFAILCNGIWTTILVLSGSYETLYSYSILPGRVDLLYHDCRGRLHSAAQVAGCAPAVPDVVYPYTLWLFVAVSVWFMADALVTQTLPSLMAFVILAAGAVAYRMRSS
jgi:hypothetical protein